MLALAARTRKAPEFLLGLSLVLPIVGYATMVVTTRAAGGEPPRFWIEVGAGIIDAGFVAVVGFVWLVFRPDEAWARGFAALLALGCLSMPVVNHLVPWSGGLPSAMGPRAALRTAAYFWASVEALRYARLMARRVRFGLAEPLVADRFRLWGIAHLFAAVMIGFFTLGGALHVRHNVWADACAWVATASGLPATFSLALSFFPPAFYVRAVERRFSLEVSA